MKNSKANKRKRFIYDEGDEVDCNAGRVGTVLPQLDGTVNVHFLSPRKSRRTSKTFPACPPPPPSVTGDLETTSDVNAPIPSVEGIQGAANSDPDPQSGMASAKEGTKKNNTIAPHKYMNDFMSWAQSLLNIFRAREADPLIGKACTLCPLVKDNLDDAMPVTHSSNSESTPSPTVHTSPASLCPFAAYSKPPPSTAHASQPQPSPQSLAYYRCESCFDAPPLCQTCVVRVHLWNPFHRVKQWNGTHFTSVSLMDLGQVVQLGHRGGPCPSMHAKAHPRALTVVHTNGVHSISVRYCQCQKDDDNPFTEKPLQLWRAGLWPATYKTPETAFTLEVLKYYDRLTLQAKTTAQDFVATLRRLTNHAFGYLVVNRYREFMTASRGFTYIQALKRFGLDVQTKLEPRSLAVLCPACPQPENMDPGWQSRAPQDRYLDALHYAKDGNFVLCHHAKKMDILDTALTDGASYYVDSEEYADFLKSVEDDPDSQQETEICNEFQAGKSRYSGKIKSGQVSMSCSRHGFVMPTGTVDLIGGEKYGPVDWATISALFRWIGFILLVISSYDINCKYGINWLRRLTKIVGLDRVKIWPLIRRCVPKWHANAHSGVCRWINSFYFMPGAGQTDGEEPERRWAVMNLLGRAIREMTPGHRIDTINHHYSDYNAQKLFGLARVLRHKWDAAAAACTKHAQELADFEGTLRKNDLPLSQWKDEERVFLEQMMLGSVDQRDIKNPYEPPADTAPSLKAVRDRLSAEELCVKQRTSKTKARKGHKDLSNPDTLKAALIELFLDGLEIEHDQHTIIGHVKELLKNKSAISETEDDIATSPVVKRLRRALQPRLAMWFQTHTALFSRLLADVHADPSLSTLDLPSRDTQCEPEDEVLPFPHIYPEPLRQHSVFSLFLEAEREVRRAQASDALREIRQKQGLHAFLWKKTAGTFGQQAKTRNQTTLRDVKDKIEASRQAYERTRVKLHVIADPSDIEDYRPLTADDCRNMTIYHHQEAPGMKTKNVSWIWRDGKSYGTETDKFTLEAVRIEWFRASARSQRWQEEMLLLEVEMRRTQRWYRFQYQEWVKRSLDRSNTGLVASGKAAYADRQAARWLQLFNDAHEKFPVAQHVGLTMAS